MITESVTLPPRRLFVWVDGNIAAGKTTVLESMSKHSPGLGISYERFDELESLQMFYRAKQLDMISLSFMAVQNGIIHDHLVSFMKAVEGNEAIHVFDRSLWGSLAFIKTACDNDVITCFEWSHLKEYIMTMADVISHVCKIHNIGMLLLRMETPPRVCLNRHFERNNTADKGSNNDNQQNSICIDYLEKLDKNFEESIHYWSKNSTHYTSIIPAPSIPKTAILFLDTISLFAKKEGLKLNYWL